MLFITSEHSLAPICPIAHGTCGVHMFMIHGHKPRVLVCGMDLGVSCTFRNCVSTDLSRRNLQDMLYQQVIRDIAI
jgi:hypothetical protein